MTKLAAIGAVRVKPFSAPLFFIHAGQSLRVARAASGCLYAGTRAHEGKAFSLTVWESPAQMKTFAQSQEHKRAMKWAWLTAETFHFCHFQVDALPSWEDAIARWKAKEALVHGGELGQKRAF